MNKKPVGILLLLIFTVLFPLNGLCNTNQRIYVNLPSFTLNYYDNESNLYQYPIAIGSAKTQTPIGTYRLISKTKNPTWRPKDRPHVPPGPNNPLGTRWMGFFRGYGIHGNNNATSIGTHVSAGCIRMYNHHAEELYSMVRLNTPVIIDYNTIVPKRDKYSGRWIVEVFKDIYNKGTNRVSVVEEIIDRYLPDSKGTVFEERIKNINRENVVFAKGTVVIFNNKTLTDDSFFQDEILLINKEAISDALGLEVYFEELENVDSVKFIFKGQEIRVYKDIGKTYVALEDLARILDLKVEYKENIDTIYITHVYSTINGHYLTANVSSVYTPGQIQYNASRPRVAIRDLVDALNMNIDWVQNSRTATVNGTIIEGSLINSRLYVDLDELQKKLGINYLWEPTLGRIRFFYDKRVVMVNGEEKPLTFKNIDGFLLVPYNEAQKYLEGISDLAESFRLNLNNEEYIFLQLVENLKYDFNKLTKSLLINYSINE